MRGRTPKPAAVKKAQGNPGKRAIKKDPLARAPGTKRWPAPAFLCAIGKGAWNSIVPKLDRLGMVNDVNTRLLETLCDNYAAWRRCQRAVREEGMFYRDDKGVIRKHPACQMSRDLARELRTAGADFGITPASAGRVQPMGTPEQPTLTGLDAPAAVDPNRATAPQLPDDLAEFIFGATHH